MERHLHRRDYQNGKLTIEIDDAAHFIDSWNWAVKQGLESQFNSGILYLLRMALGAAIPQNQFEHEGTTIDAVPGLERKITIWPDAFNAPSFLWHEDKGMSGGLIYHESSQTWGIHT